MTQYFTLRALSSELNAELRGLRIAGAYTQTKDELLLRLSNGLTLCTSVRPAFTYCFLQEGVTRARRNTVDLFPSAAGATIDGIRTLPYDRTLVVEFTGGSAVALRLYGTATSNILLLDDHGRVVDAFKNREELRGTTPAPERRFDEAVLSGLDAFTRRLRDSAKPTVGAALREAVPFLGSLYAAEVFYRSGVTATAETADAEVPARLLAATLEIIAEADNPMPKVYEEETLAVVPLRHLAGRPGVDYESVNEAIRALAHASARARDFSEDKRLLAHRLTAESERLERALRAVEKNLREADRADGYEMQGKLLLAQLDRVRKGMTEAELEDLFGSGGRVRVSLDPALSPVQNAEALFAKARRARSARTEAERRQRSLEQRHRLVTLLSGECEALATSEDLQAFQKRHTKTLRKMNSAATDRNEEVLPFRVFTVSGGYAVWVGKSSSNNDLLTLKYAKPHDLWFHARGASGSHTVLKARDKSEKIPKEAIRDAAAIAAYYSKMRKGKAVPVAYCERKYVRKPKGAPAGTVTLEREEVMFVDPRLPASEV